MNLVKDTYVWVSPMTGKVYPDDFGLCECEQCHNVGHEFEFFKFEFCSSECEQSFLFDEQDTF